MKEVAPPETVHYHPSKSAAASIEPGSPPPGLKTAQDLLQRVQTDISQTLQVHRNQASARRALGKATKQPLTVIPLDPAYLTAKVFAWRHTSRAKVRRTPC
jgi:hypothetical protein